jgi:hypothetical protein
MSVSKLLTSTLLFPTFQTAFGDRLRDLFDRDRPEIGSHENPFDRDQGMFGGFFEALNDLADGAPDDLASFTDDNFFNRITKSSKNRNSLIQKLQ